MKGVIILPKHLEPLWDRYSNSGNFNKVLSANAPFFYTMRDTFGFELRYADAVDVDFNTDIVFMFAVPYHNRPKLIPGLLDLNKNTKLIMWPGDLQCYNNKMCMDNKIKVFDRCDVIVSPVHEMFVEIYPQFLHKYKFMPKFFSPQERYTNLLFNNTPKIKCLLSGSINKEVYPLRSLIMNHNDIDYKPPTYVGDTYAKLLHSYFCCVATSSIFNYALSKHYEIPATGSLLLANETNDLKKAGFIPYRHYIPITKENVFIKISQCLKNPIEYDVIRKEGMMFVRENHSIVNRIEQLKKIFNDLMK